MNLIDQATAVYAWQLPIGQHQLEQMSFQQRQWGFVNYSVIELTLFAVSISTHMSSFPPRTGVF